MSMQMAVARGAYQGDPGLLGFLKGLARTGVKLFTEGPIGAAEMALSQIRGPRPIPPLPTAAPGLGYRPREMKYAFPDPGTQRVPPKGFFPRIKEAAFGTSDPAARNGVAAMNGKALSGYHWNKTSYFTKSEGWIEAGTKLVKNRRRNPGNMKAASRSIARLSASKNAMKMLNRVTVRKPECARK